MKPYVIMALSLFTFLSCSFVSKPEEPMTYYAYGAGNGYALWAERYKAELKEDGTVKLTYGRTEDMSAEEYGDTLIVDASVMKHIEEIYLEHKMYKYKKHYKPLFDVTDGDGWGVSAEFGISRRERKFFSASGYEAWPKDDGIKIINSYIKSFFNTDSDKTDQE